MSYLPHLIIFHLFTHTYLIAMPPKPKRTERTVAGATGGTTAPTTRRAAAAAKQSSTNSRATTTAAGKRATSSSKQKGNNATGATGTITTAPFNQKEGISATAAIAAAIGTTTAAPTKQKGGVTTDSNDWLVTHQNILLTRWLKNLLGVLLLKHWWF
jgi:hypothetical protein